MTWLENSQKNTGADLSAGALCICPACAAPARRPQARFCSTCGRVFDGRGYLPADALRASYHLHHQSMKVPPATSRTASLGSYMAPEASRLSRQPDTLFSQPINNASAIALAFVTYALVPYLGILFCPGAIFMGSVGVASSYRSAHRDGRRGGIYAIGFGLLILCGQILLWWILYKIPEWATGP